MKPFCIAISLFCLFNTTIISGIPDAQPSFVRGVTIQPRFRFSGLLAYTVFFVSGEPALAAIKTKPAYTLTFSKAHARKWALLKWNAAHLKSGRPVIRSVVQRP